MELRVRYMGKLKIIYHKIDEIELYDNNPRLNENAVPALVRSIQEFGFLVPVVVDRNMVCVCGHTRIAAAKELGMTEVPCIMADELTDEQVKAFRLADNQVSQLSGWDFPKLDIEIEDLTKLGWDMTDFGFQEYEPVPDPDIPDRPEEQEQPPAPVPFPEMGGTPGDEYKVMVIFDNEDDADAFSMRMLNEGLQCVRLR